MKKNRRCGGVQGLGEPSVIAQRTPWARPEKSLVQFFFFSAFDVGISSQTNIFKWLSPAVLLYTLEGHCDHWQIAVNQADTWLPLSDRTVAAQGKVFCYLPVFFLNWGSVIKVRVHLLDDRRMLDVIGTAIRCAKTQHGLLCALQTQNQGQFVYVSATQ